MGCCCAESGRSSSSKDKYVPTERHLNLHLIRFQQFFDILFPLCDRGHVSYDDLMKAFKDYFISSDLKEESDSLLKQLLECKYFSKEEGVSPVKFMSLGWLYTGGTYDEKAEAVIRVYDLNGDGEIFINSVKQWLRGMFQISAFMIPALHRGERIQELREEEEEELKQQVGVTVLKMFKQEFKIKTNELKDELRGNMRFLFSSVSVRELFRRDQSQ